MKRGKEYWRRAAASPEDEWQIEGDVDEVEIAVALQGQKKKDGMKPGSHSVGAEAFEVAVGTWGRLERRVKRPR